MSLSKVKTFKAIIALIKEITNPDIEMKLVKIFNTMYLRGQKHEVSGLVLKHLVFFTKLTNFDRFKFIILRVSFPLLF